ncbi:MAG: 50S ribosomal protein L33 [Gammaproteobacteria bacterium CG11_big_fil_rev_8_21_14_0_20_46_22]|nr:MAG: 50S ribosomal protein L33 [Gammaproteobacteria bacterium CG12_big_fil_rev_8_21_14_0_65_46_12]PIR11041.1 MAG: 50S ribosomal protein L33 [Gammaproteobacteria bacterium CG11_big_fil_rev_8_21_14_0_20_46_22]
MAAIREKIRMISTGLNQKGKKTGYFKTTTKNKRSPMAEKGKFRKKYFDPRAYNPETGKCGMHVEFVEDKIK